MNQQLQMANFWCFSVARNCANENPRYQVLLGTRYPRMVQAKMSFFWRRYLSGMWVPAWCLNLCFFSTGPEWMFGFGICECCLSHSLDPGTLRVLQTSGVHMCCEANDDVWCEANDVWFIRVSGFQRVIVVLMTLERNCCHANAFDVHVMSFVSSWKNLETLEIHPLFQALYIPKVVKIGRASCSVCHTIRHLPMARLVQWN